MVVASLTGRRNTLPSTRVEVRSRGRHLWRRSPWQWSGGGDPARAWLVQPCVDVTSSGKAGLLEAHDLAVGLQPAMILPAIQDALTRRGLGKLAAALQADSHGGLSGPAYTAVLNELRARIANGARPPRRHRRCSRHRCAIRSPLPRRSRRAGLRSRCQSACAGKSSHRGIW